MDAPTSSPADWRSRYGFDQPADAGLNNYWNVNNANGAKAALSVNAMPYVMSPPTLGYDPAQNKASMYSQQGMQGMQGMGPGMGQGASQGDPLSQILGLVQSNPQLMPLLLQRLQGGGQG